MQRSAKLVVATGAWFVVLCLTVGSGSRADAPARPRLADVPVDYRLLERQDASTYDIAMHVGEIGVRGEMSFTANVRMSTTVTRDHVLMEDDWQIMGRSIGLRMTCDRGPLLRLRETKLTMSRKDQSLTATMRIAGEGGVIEANGEQQEIPYPTDTLMQAAAFRLVPMLPREAGAVFEFDHYTESVEIKVRSPESGKTFSIECLGTEAVAIRGDDIRCTRYVLNVPKPIEFFVDNEGAIRMVLADGGSTVMVRRDPGVAGATGELVR